MVFSLKEKQDDGVQPRCRPKYESILLSEYQYYGSGTTSLKMRVQSSTVVLVVRQIVHLDLMYIPKQFKWFVALEVAYKLLPCLLLISNMLMILTKTNMYTQSVAT
jgi:hypothetical protein